MSFDLILEISLSLWSFISDLSESVRSEDSFSFMCFMNFYLRSETSSLAMTGSLSFCRFRFSDLSFGLKNKLLPLH